MPFERPTLAQLIARARADIATRFDSGSADLRGTPEEVLAISQAGLTHGLHGHLKYLSKQLLADLADDDFLLRHAAIYGLERTAATPATGQLTITGTESAVCPTGTVWQRPDGTLYTQAADVTIESGVSTAVVTAQVGGVAGNADVGAKLTLAAPVTGIIATATVSGDGLADGVDLETLDSLRERLILRLQTPPSGGGPGDYVRWAREVAGVTRAWEYPAMLGPGTVGVRFVMDNQVGSIIPDSGMVSTVHAYLNGKAPVTAQVVVLAPVAVQLDLILAVTPSTSAVKAAVTAAVAAFIRSTAEPGSTILISQLNEAIAIAAGETDHILSLPTGNVAHTANQIAVPGTITWS